MRLSYSESITILSSDDVERQEYLELNRYPYLVPGYQVLPAGAPHDDTFSFFGRVNADRHDTWTTFVTLLRMVPDPIIFSLYAFDETAIAERECTKQDILSLLEPVAQDVVNDTNLVIILEHDHGSQPMRLHFSDGKTFYVLGTDPIAFRSALEGLGLNEIPDLCVIDDLARMITFSSDSTQQLITRLRAQMDA